MKIIDLKISNAFRRMKAALGTDAEMARVLQLSRAHVGRILHGSVIYLENDTWNRIAPVLARYFRDDADVSLSTLDPLSIRSLPVIRQEELATANTLLMPITEWAEEHAVERVAFAEGCEGDFVLRVTDDTMMPWYPLKTLLLVRPSQHLQNGDRVIAVLHCGQVVFKIFAEKANRFALFSPLGDDSADLIFRKNDPEPLRAIYLVVQSRRDENALERAMEKKGGVRFWKEKLRAM